MIKKLAKRLSVDEEAVKAELGKLKGDYSVPRKPIAPSEIKRDARKAETVLLALLMGGGPYVDRTMSALSLDEFKDSSVRDAVGAIFSLHKENKEINPAKLISLLGSNGETVSIISEAVSFLEIISEKGRALEDCIARIKKDNIKDRLSMLQEAIRIAHGQKDEDMVRRLVGEYHDLVKIDKA
jgi:hypothetical protein